MVLSTWLRQLPAKLKVWSIDGHTNGTTQGTERFRYEIAREKMRTDRNGSPLAVLIVELPANRATQRDVQYLCDVLHERLRITDTVGVLSARCIGVLLPDTLKSGAWKVASDVCSSYPVGHDRPNCEVYVYPDDDHIWPENADTREAQPTGTAAERQMNSLLAEPMPASKRAVDIAGATLGLVLAGPLFALLAAAIKLTSRGPAVYKQEREGLGGRRFYIYKFRTMRLDADQQQSALRSYNEQDGPAFKMSRDPRTTWLGRCLRKSSLDELPQLWNVLRGEMSLVGPRPLPTSESLQCTPWQRRRLMVTPGMTCIWQIWGRNTVPFDEWMRMDLQYIRRRSFGYDLRLLLTTGPAIVLKPGPR